jgi:hypothetical protein
MTARAGPIFRYVIRCTQGSRAILWWHDSAIEYPTDALASEVCQRLRDVHGQSVRLASVARYPSRDAFAIPEGQNNIEVLDQTTLPVLHHNLLPP